MCSRTSNGPDWFAALAQLPGPFCGNRVFQPLAKIAFILIAVCLDMESYVIIKGDGREAEGTISILLDGHDVG